MASHRTRQRDQASREGVGIGERSQGDLPGPGAPQHFARFRLKAAEGNLPSRQGQHGVGYYGWDGSQAGLGLTAVPKWGPTCLIRGHYGCLTNEGFSVGICNLGKQERFQNHLTSRYTPELIRRGAKGGPTIAENPCVFEGLISHRNRIPEGIKEGLRVHFQASSCAAMLPNPHTCRHFMYLSMLAL